jgi:hypothetical protein
MDKYYKLFPDLVEKLIKINYGQIGDQTGLFYTTNPVFYTSGSGNRFVRSTGTFGNLNALMKFKVIDKIKVTISEML